jgi:hypothetical protein
MRKYIILILILLFCSCFNRESKQHIIFYELIHKGHVANIDFENKSFGTSSKLIISFKDKSHIVWEGYLTQKIPPFIYLYKYSHRTSGNGDIHLMLENPLPMTNKYGNLCIEINRSK